MLIVQSDPFNRSRISTVVAVALTSNARLANVPGNVLLAARETGLQKDAVANVSQLITVDRVQLIERAGRIPAREQSAVNQGLKLVLGL